MRKLSFSARTQRGFIDPFHPPKSKWAWVGRWAWYFAFAVLWIFLTTLWVIEAGNPYP